MGLIAFILYPSVSELPTPEYSELVITSAAPIGTVEYAVAQVSAATAQVAVRVSLAPGGSGGTATLTVLLPFGNTFVNCHPPACHEGTGAGSYWTERLIFGPTEGPVQAVTVAFTVKADHFGAISNGVTASAVIPEVTYQGALAPGLTLLAGYKIPSAADYDWPSFQPQHIANDFVTWAEGLSNGDTQSRVAIGINHAAQTSHDFMIFLAGALVGVAGAAVLAAIQEALHAGDTKP